MRKLLNNKWMFRFAAVCFAAQLIPTKLWAAGPPQKSELDNPLAITLLIVIGALLLAIALLAHVVIGAAQLKVERFKKDKVAAAAKVASILLLSLFSTAVFAQDANTATETQQVVSNTIGGLSKTSFYSLLVVIGLELLVILWMLWFLRSFIAKEYAVEVSQETAVAKESSWKKWWIKINSFRSMQEEQDIDMGHDYDNIRELDNKLPPWWIYGFYVTIIFAGIYLWRYHVSHSAPLSAEELQIAMTKAEEEKANNLKKAGNSIDENTVKLLTAVADLEAGKKLYTGTCAPCHAADGGGVVGPNLTDDYWLHGGSVNEVFKTIKYGVPEKGMQPWKSAFSPTQIAQLTSYIKSIRGTKVANPKEPQGELYKEQAAPSDTTKIAAVKQP
jgi:cytochrome c oxidase cbb3-type subunit 3